VNPKEKHTTLRSRSRVIVWKRSLQPDGKNQHQVSSNRILKVHRSLGKLGRAGVLSFLEGRIGCNFTCPSTGVMESNEAEVKAFWINYVAKSWRIDAYFVALVLLVAHQLPVIFILLCWLLGLSLQINNQTTKSFSRDKILVWESQSRSVMAAVRVSFSFFNTVVNHRI
jgi:hypothetical protein